MFELYTGRGLRLDEATKLVAVGKGHIFAGVIEGQGKKQKSICHGFFLVAKDGTFFDVIQARKITLLFAGSYTSAAKQFEELYPDSMILALPKLSDDNLITIDNAKQKIPETWSALSAIYPSLQD